MLGALLNSAWYEFTGSFFTHGYSVSPFGGIIKNTYLQFCLRKYFYLTCVRSNPGIHATIIKVAIMQATPPLITENCGVVKPATNPDSN